MTGAAPRILVHAGFHKTGTTSLQGFLQDNRALLRPWARIHMKRGLGPLRYLGRWYGQRPVIWRRWLFRAGLARVLATLPDDPVIVISRESLSGMMPGFTRRGRMVTGYAEAPVLAREIVRGLRRRFGPGARIEFLYTLREREAWLASIHGHILRTSPVTEDFAAFRARFGPPPDLAAEAAAVARAVAPVPVHTRWLEQAAGHRLGPGRFMLELLGVPEAEWPRFPDAATGNPGPSAALRARFLDLNRSAGRAARAEKARLAAAERQATGPQR